VQRKIPKIQRKKNSDFNDGQTSFTSLQTNRVLILFASKPGFTLVASQPRFMLFASQPDLLSSQVNRIYIQRGNTGLLAKRQLRFACK